MRRPFATRPAPRHGAMPLPQALLTALVLLGTAARMAQYLGQTSYWYDEAYVLLNIRERSYLGLLEPLGWHQIHPRGFLWLVRAAYDFAGMSELATRLPAFAATLAAPFVMIPLARCALDRFGVFVAVALIAVSTHALTHIEVKEFALDLLVTELILLGTCRLLQGQERDSRGGIGVALAVMTLLAPWLSFASLFVLAGAVVALAVAALGGRAGWRPCFELAATAAVAAALVWALVMWHADYAPHLPPFAPCFADLSSPTALLRWAAGSVIQVGQYATQGMGVPLIVLGALGLAALGRRAPALAVLIGSPMLPALAAAALRAYPFCDRLVFFLAPCVWLAAAAGLARAVERLLPRHTWIGIALTGVLVLPGAVKDARVIIDVEPRSDFRTAFAYVHAHRQPGEALWVSHPEVYQVYFGTEPAPLSPYVPLEQTRQTVSRQRLWMVYTPQHPGLSSYADVFDAVHAAATRVEHHGLHGVEIALYAPRAVGR